jgi:hypothetical protein
MSLEVEGGDGSEEERDDLYSYANWILANGIWDGRHITLADAPYFQNEMEQKITDMLFSQHPDSVGFQQMAAFLAWIGTDPEQRPLVTKDIQALDFSSNTLILQISLGKSLSKFWKKHKVAILVGVSVLAAVTVVTAVAVCSGAAAAGAAGLEGLKKGTPEKKAPLPDSTSKLANTITPHVEHPPSSSLEQKPAAIHTETLSTTSISTPPRPPKNIVFFDRGFELNGQYCSYDEWRRRSYCDKFLSSLHTNPAADLNPKTLEPIVSKPDPHILERYFPALMQPRFEAIPKEFSCRIGYMNGMNNSFNEANENLDYLQSFVPENIELAYNRSHGPIIDFGEAFFVNYSGFSPNTSTLLLEKWTQFHEDNKDNPHAKYLQFCHSQACIHVRNTLENAPKEISDRILVVAIAPGAIVSKKLCYDSFNYACKGDIVPYGELNYIGLGNYTGELSSSAVVEKIFEIRKELILLDPHPGAKSNHAFMNPAFEKVIKDHMEDYLNRNGQYK